MISVYRYVNQFCTRRIRKTNVVSPAFSFSFILHFDLNLFFRQAIEKLMIINPLAEHIDLRDHYLAFIDLEKFGLEKELQDERCTQ